MHTLETLPLSNKPRAEKSSISSLPDQSKTRQARAVEAEERLSIRKQAAETSVTEFLEKISRTTGKSVTLDELGETGKIIKEHLRALQEEINEGESIIALSLLMQEIRKATPPTNAIH